MIKIKSLNAYIAIAIACIMCFGCKSSNDEPPLDADRTIIVYMVASNNLSGYARFDIDEMKAGMRANNGNGGRLVVYHTTNGATPHLFEITADGSEKELAVYDNNESSVSIARMRQVMADVKRLVPAKDYGLVLWSHATGWINDSGVIDESTGITPQSFGADGNPVKKMKLSSLARALDGNRFSFIYFDCCHMATVEVAYELRHVTSRIVASPSELHVDGMPYQLNIPLMFKSTPQLEQAALNTYNQYVNQPNGCDITIIETAALDELAAATRSILTSGASLPQDYRPVNYFRTIVMSTGIFDMRHYIDNLTGVDAGLRQRWNEAYSHAVSFFRTTTPYVFQCPSADFHGLGCQIINNLSEASIYDYNDTAWWRDVVSARFNPSQD